MKTAVLCENSCADPSTTRAILKSVTEGNTTSHCLGDSLKHADVRAASQKLLGTDLGARVNDTEDEKHELGNEHDGIDEEYMLVGIQSSTAGEGHNVGKGNIDSQQSSESVEWK